MRLKLNRTLRAALIAAISTVGFTLTQAQAVTLTEVISMESMASQATITAGTSLSTHWEMTGGVVYDFDGSGYLGGIKDANLLAALKGDQYVTVAAWINPSVGNVGGDGCAIFGYGAQDDGVKVIAHKDGMLKFTTKAVADFTTSATGIDKNEWQLVAVTMHKNGEQLEIKYMLNDAFGNVVSNTSANAATTDSFAIGSGNSESIREPFKGSIGDLTVFTSSDWATFEDVSAKMGSKPQELTTIELVWKGTGESAVWNTEAENWQRGGETIKYISGPATIATFGTDGAKAVNVTDTIMANGISVQDNYTFTVENGKSLQTSSLTVADGKKATFAGSGSISVGTLSGAVGINEGTTVTLTDIVTLNATNTLNVSGEGTLSVATVKVAGGTHTISSNLNVTGGGNGEGGGNNSQGIHFSGGNATLNINAGTTTVSGAVYSNQNGAKLNIGTGEKDATLVAHRMELSDAGSSALNIGSKGKLVITSSNDANGSTGAYKTTGLLLSEWNGSTTATVNGKLYAQNVSMYTGDSGMTLNINNGGVVAVKGIATNLAQSGHTSSSTINLAAGGKIVLGASGMADCTLAPWTINLNGGEIGITADATIARALNVAGSVTFNTAKYAWNGTGASLTLTEGGEGGTMTISGNLTGTGSITKVGAGKLVLSGTGNALSHTMNVQAGTLELSGTFAIDNITDGEQVVKTVDYEGHDSENGFHMTTGTMKVYGTSGDGQVSLAGAHFTYQNNDVTDQVVEGVYTLAGTPDKSVVYVNKGTLAIAGYKAVASDDLTGVVLANDTTLTADSAATYAVTLADNASATVNATEATNISSLTGSAAGKTLTTSGTVALTSKLTDAYAGNFIVAGGTLSIANGTAGDSFHIVTVRQGGTFDLKGKANTDYRLRFELDGGILTNTGTNTGAGNIQNDQITLLSNSEVSGTGNFHMIAPSFETSYLNLNNHKLTKTGTNTMILFNTHVNEGTIEVKGGAIDFSAEHGVGETAADVILSGGVIAGTLNMTKDISLTAATTTDNNQAVTVTGTGKTLTMTTEGEAALTLSQGLTVTSGTVAVDGKVTISGHSLDLSSNNASTGKVEVGATSTLNVTAGMWVGSNSAGILLEQGGIVNIDGLRIVAAADGAAITSTAENTQFSTESANIKITGSTVNVTGEVTLGNTLDGVAVVVDNGGSLTLQTAADSVTVGAGGTINKGEGGSFTDLTVENGGTIGSGIDATEAKIAADATMIVESGSISDSGVFVFSLPGNTTTVTNEGNDAAKYEGLQNNGAMKVTADTLYAGNEETVTVANSLVVDTITHVGTGALTLTQVDKDVLTMVSTDTANLTIMGVDATSLTEMSIGTGATVAVYTDGTATMEGKVTITDTLTAGGGTLLANLEMADGSMLDVNGGNAMALTLGSEFTIADGALVKLDGATLAAIAGLENIGDKVILIQQYEDHALTTNLVDGDWSRTHFDLSSITGADYQLFVQDGQIGLVKSSMVPEPTTGTLSLLALAALAARRRRK